MTCSVPQCPHPEHDDARCVITVGRVRGTDFPVVTLEFANEADWGAAEAVALMIRRTPDVTHALVGLVKAAKALSRVVTQHEDHVKAQDALYDALVTAEAALNG